MKAWLMAVLIAVPLGAMAEGRWVEVSGQAQGQLPVDKVHLQSRIELVAKDPVSAKEQVDAQVAGLLALFREHRIPKQSVDAGSLRVSPEYHYQDRTRELVGYRASRSIGLNLDAGESGKWLALLLENGVNQVDEPRYWSSDGGNFEKQLMETAFKDAMDKAKRLAKVSGNKLGEVLMIQESRGGMPRPMMAMSRMEADVAYQPGGQEMTATVLIRVGLTD
ncbi:SIMPL domain-containing protein [Ferrimonas futtsuensis]|uniref:SIMPL domain-containing protein n=1 Tax=Ferrimonas futtsuensis TaxID=364764 RepID=UPI00042495C7|nr:SIMPL domain-containing protein [Ferrimonas futtsuensis]